MRDVHQRRRAFDRCARSDGEECVLDVPREEAVRRFNAGECRFLISTEAGGEGIDLQERCHTLVHVDLPWNPMRLHQRVGRLNRYGQKTSRRSAFATQSRYSGSR